MCNINFEEFSVKQGIIIGSKSHSNLTNSLPVCVGPGGYTNPGGGGGGPVGAVAVEFIPWKSFAVYGGGGSIFLLFAI